MGLAGHESSSDAPVATKKVPTNLDTFLHGVAFLLLVAFGIAYYWSIKDLPPLSRGYPELILVVMFIAVIPAAAKDVYQIIVRRQAPAQELEGIPWILFVRLAGIMVVLVAFIAAVPLFGYLVPLGLYVLLTILILGYRKIPVTVLATGGMVAFVYYLFVKILMVPLPGAW